jgi:Zn ribbon nucleic-acid-binding protein
VNDPDYLLQCPQCQSLGVIDDDQYHGRVSVLCECGYHETKDWSTVPAHVRTGEPAP